MLLFILVGLTSGVFSLRVGPCLIISNVSLTRAFLEGRVLFLADEFYLLLAI
jgi:hypothetical protein